MIKGGVIFGAIIVKIVGTRSPKEPELTLSFATVEPVVLRVHGFGITLDDGFIRNTNHSGVIALDGRSGLRPTHINKVLTNLDHGFGTDEEARNFGFGSRGHEKLDNLGNNKDIAVSVRDRSVFRKHDVGTSMAVGFANIKIGAI